MTMGAATASFSSATTSARPARTGDHTEDRAPDRTHVSGNVRFRAVAPPNHPTPSAEPTGTSSGPTLDAVWTGFFINIPPHPLHNPSPRNPFRKTTSPAHFSSPIRVHLRFHFSTELPNEPTPSPQIHISRCYKCYTM